MSEEPMTKEPGTVYQVRLPTGSTAEATGGLTGSTQPEFVEGSSGSNRPAEATPTRAVLGPEAAFNSDSDDDNDYDQEEALKKARRAKQNMEMCRAARESGRRRDKRRQYEMDHPSPVTPYKTLPVVPWSKTTQPRDMPIVPLPRVNHRPIPSMDPGFRHAPEGLNWPVGVPYPEDTDKRLADEWYNAVPLQKSQVEGLMHEAYSQQSGALYRARHLIQQIDADPLLMASLTMRYLKECWRNPARGQWRETPRKNRPQKKGLQQPKHDDPVNAWIKYYRWYPDAVPRYLQRENRQGPSEEEVMGHVLMRHFLPHGKGLATTTRAALVDTLSHLFSVEGLYESIIERGGYPHSQQENVRPIPGDGTNVSLFDAAHWAAECGVAGRTLQLLHDVAVQDRNYCQNEPHDSVVPWTDFPRSINDVTIVHPLIRLRST